MCSGFNVLRQVWSWGNPVISGMPMFFRVPPQCSLFFSSGPDGMPTPCPWKRSPGRRLPWPEFSCWWLSSRFPWRILSSVRPVISQTVRHRWWGVAGVKWEAFIGFLATHLETDDQGVYFFILPTCKSSLRIFFCFVIVNSKHCYCLLDLIVVYNFLHFNVLLRNFAFMISFLLNFRRTYLDREDTDYYMYFTLLSGQVHFYI